MMMEMMSSPETKNKKAERAMYRVSISKEFDILPKDWKEFVRSADNQKLNSIIADLTKEELVNLAEYKNDADLNKAKENVKRLAEPYKTRTKLYKLRIKYIMEVLNCRE